MVWFYLLFFLVVGALLVAIGYEITRICEATSLYELFKGDDNEEDS